MSDCYQYDLCDYDEGFSTEFIDGATYGSWEVIPGTKRVDQYRDGIRTTVQVECYCGKSMRVHVPALCGLSKCCYHRMTEPRILQGMMFGFWETVKLEWAQPGDDLWLCECLPCGTQQVVSSKKMLAGHSRMCDKCQMQAVLI